MNSKPFGQPGSCSESGKKIIVCFAGQKANNHMQWPIGRLVVEPSRQHICRRLIVTTVKPNVGLCKALENGWFGDEWSYRLIHSATLPRVSLTVASGTSDLGLDLRNDDGVATVGRIVPGGACDGTMRCGDVIRMVDGARCYTCEAAVRAEVAASRACRARALPLEVFVAFAREVQRERALLPELDNAASAAAAPRASLIDRAVALLGGGDARAAAARTLRSRAVPFALFHEFVLSARNAAYDPARVRFSSS